jgi:hypothetical protein
MRNILSLVTDGPLSSASDVAASTTIGSEWGSDLIGELLAAKVPVVNTLRTPWHDYVELIVDSRDFVNPATIAGVEKVLSARPKLAGMVRFSAGEKPILAQLTAGENRLNGAPGNRARAGKQISTPINCTAGPLMRNQNGPQQFIVTAGHCINGNITASWSIPGFSISSMTLTYRPFYCDSGLVTSPCIAWGTDAALLEAPWWSTPNNQLIWSSDPSHYYLDPVLGAGDGWVGNSNVCMEGASPVKYIGVGQIHDDRTVCGLDVGADADGFEVVHITNYGVVCGGDSGSVVRYPSGVGGSYVNGTLRGRGMFGPLNGSPLSSQCSQRFPNSLSPAFFNFTRYTRLRDSLGPMVGQTLTIQTQPGWV